MAEALLWFVASAAYLAAGAATATETALRIRDHVLRGRYEWSPDREDLTLIVLAGVLWPPVVLVAAVAVAWTRQFERRKIKKEAQRGSA